MTENRWRILMGDEHTSLTEDEIKDGWHFCCGSIKGKKGETKWQGIMNGLKRIGTRRADQ